MTRLNQACALGPVTSNREKPLISSRPTPSRTAAHSCAPNCALEVVRGLRRDDGSVADTLVKGDRVRQAQVGLRLRALRPIAAGEEITFCYLPDLDLRAEFRDRRRPVWESISESGPTKRREI